MSQAKVDRYKEEKSKQKESHAQGEGCQTDFASVRWQVVSSSACCVDWIFCLQYV